MLSYLKVIIAIAVLVVSAAPVPVKAAEVVKSVALGRFHTCFRDGFGEVFCWGVNGNGQLGNGVTELVRLIPDAVPLDEPTIDLAVGSAHSCAITISGKAYCWGGNVAGELGNGTLEPSLTPVPVIAGEFRYSRVAAGAYRTCFIDRVGTLTCAGWNQFGYLGDGTQQDAQVPVKVLGFERGTLDVAIGSNHACALNALKEVYCWGSNSINQLGDPSYTSSASPIKLNGLPADIAQISAGTQHSCAVTDAGEVWCWGNNLNGELGTGDSVAQTVPVKVNNLPEKMSSVAAGHSFTCALSVSQQVYCWGRNNEFQLAAINPINSTLPLKVYYPYSDFKQVFASGYRACGLTTQGDLVCWGDGSHGLLGNGEVGKKAEPTWVRNYPNPPTFRLVSPVPKRIGVGAQHACAIDKNNALYCWGFNSFGTIGDGTTEQRLTAVPVTALRYSVAEVSVGILMTCALTKLGEALCWGGEETTSVGNGIPETRLWPTTIGAFASGVNDISTGSGKSCLLDNAGFTYCWGSNFDGGLGSGLSLADRRFSPHRLPDNTYDYVDISVGMSNHVCRVARLGRVECWGYNTHGQLGTNNQNNTTSPVQVQGLPLGAVHVSTAGQSSCALLGNGTVYCWGRNHYGQFGTLASTQYLLPVKVENLPEVIIKISITGENLCALGVSGSLYCLGANYLGQLGLGTSTPSAVPVAVPLAKKVADFSAGFASICALTVSDKVFCWGRGAGGILGNGTTTNSYVPVQVIGFSAQTPEFNVVADAWPPVGGQVSCTPNIVSLGGSASCTATVAAGYSLLGLSGCTTNGDSCTLSNISSDILIRGHFMPDVYQVTGQVNRGGSADGDLATVIYGDATIFTLTPKPGYKLDTAVGGTCPAGRWLDEFRYQIGGVTDSCTVLFNFVRERMARKKLPIWLFVRESEQ